MFRCGICSLPQSTGVVMYKDYRVYLCVVSLWLTSVGAWMYASGSAAWVVSCIAFYVTGGVAYISYLDWRYRKFMSGSDRT